MLAKETVSARLNSDEGLSFTEFSYQILQGMDYLELYRRYGCTLQTGGSDQWGNLTSGTELIRKVEGRAVHALATPLITKADGTKFGKSEGGAVWLDPAMTSPYAFYQFWFNTDDRDIGGYLKVFSLRPLDGDRRAGDVDGRAAAGPGGATGAGRRADRAGARRGRPGRRSCRPAARCSAGANSPASTRAPCRRRCRRPA